ncbi:MAG: glycosyltransferase family 4 protein [Pseudomonadota bacterium]
MPGDSSGCCERPAWPRRKSDACESCRWTSSTTRHKPPPGGVGTNVSILTRRLERAGHSVVRFGCRLGPEPPDMPPYIDYTSLRGMARLRGAARIIHDFSAAEALARFLSLSRNTVDVAHAHNLYHHLTPSVLAVLRRRRIPVVMSVRDFRLLCPAKHFLHDAAVCTQCMHHRYLQCVIRNCTSSRASALALAAETCFQRFFRRYIQGVFRFLCPSQFMADALLMDCVPAGKIEVLRNPTEQSADWTDRGGGDEILYAGRVSREKGPDLMLDIARAFSDVRVCVAGDGPMLPWMRQEAARRKLGNVRFAGHLDREALEDCYRRAAVVVVPSRCFENSPNTMLEAMLRGLVVVGPNHGPFGEWLHDGSTGRLFVPADGGDLVRVVREVLADPGARARMGQAARRLVRRRHDPDTIVVRLITVYQEAIAQCE